MKYSSLNKMIFWTLLASLGLFACKSTPNKENPLLSLKAGVWKSINPNQQVPFFLQDVEENSINIAAPIWIVDDNPTQLQHYDAVIGENIVQQNIKGQWVVNYNNSKNSWVLSSSLSEDTLYCTFLDASGGTTQVAFTHLENQIPADLKKEGAIEQTMSNNIWITPSTSTDVAFTKLLANTTNNKELQFVRLVVKKEQELFTKDAVEPISLKKHEGYHFLTMSEGLFYIQGFDNEQGRVKLAPLQTTIAMTAPFYWTKLDSTIVHLDSLVNFYENLNVEETTD
jgi:hypothetical protein